MSKAYKKLQNFKAGRTLRDVVITAAHHDVASTVDVSGINWLEHINLVVGSKPLAEKFYVDFLGLTKDATQNFHVNLGQQQFHLDANGPAHRIFGSIGLALPDLDALRGRVQDATETFRHTRFDVMDEAGCVTVICPWGNVFHLYDVRDDYLEENESLQKLVASHQYGGVYGEQRMAVRGNPGIRYVEFKCPIGTSGAVAQFYREIFGCSVSSGDGSACICVGPGVHLVFSEDDLLSDVQRMEGVHVCVYANDFQGIYSRLKARNLVWTNPRFIHIDSCDTLEEATASRTLRCKDIVDLSTGKKILELEHETRPLRHGQYFKVINYDPR